MEGDSVQAFMSDCREVATTIAYVVGVVYVAVWLVGDIGESICAVGYAMGAALVVLRAEM
jgi:hypothetical protein